MDRSGSDLMLLGKWRPQVAWNLLHSEAVGSELETERQKQKQQECGGWTPGKITS